MPRTTNPLLIPAAWLYGLAIRARNAWYDRRPPSPADLPVISIGNITTGGTGKTPTVIEFVRRLDSLGRRPVVLTRGYGARVGQVADEVAELHESLGADRVVVDADRVRGAARIAAEKLGDCIVLDDGFQHRRLHRDLDVVLIDALDPFGGGRLLPAGRLREPLSSLRRASCLIVSRANQAGLGRLAQIQMTVADYVPGMPMIFSSVESAGLRSMDLNMLPIVELRRRPVLPVCGLGNPRTFIDLLRPHAGQLCPPLTFPDHHAYTAADVERICAAARAVPRSVVVTTRKDWVKLAPLWPASQPDEDVPELLRLDIRVRLNEFENVIGELLRETL